MSPARYRRPRIHPVDNVIAAMEANHPHLTTAKAFYVEISRARDRAELVTDDAQALKERLEAVTGERVSALEGIGEAPKRERDGKAILDRARPDRDRAAPPSPDKEIGREPSQQKAPEPEPPARAKRVEMDLGL